MKTHSSNNKLLRPCVSRARRQISRKKDNVGLKGFYTIHALRESPLVRRQAIVMYVAHKHAWKGRGCQQFD